MVEQADYVIVGAGGAGCVLAGRLTKMKISVLLLEAGGKDKNLFIHMPAGCSQLVPERNDQNYGFETEAEPRQAADVLAARPLLGGSSSINAMVYIRQQCL